MLGSGERDIIETCICETCGAGGDYDLCDTCAERCCMPQGAKNRLHDTDLVHRILRGVKTASLTEVLTGWLKTASLTESHRGAKRV